MVQWRAIDDRIHSGANINCQVFCIVIPVYLFVVTLRKIASGHLSRKLLTVDRFSALLKPSINLFVEPTIPTRVTSLERFEDNQKSFLYIKSPTPDFRHRIQTYCEE